MNIHVNTSNLVPGTNIEMTPAHVYAGMADFSNVLDDMRDGKFPVGTGKPFPVNFDSEIDPATQQPAMPSAWTAHCSTNLSDPPNNMVIGPKAFGL
jgi:hypothetical protein